MEFCLLKGAKKNRGALKGRGMKNKLILLCIVLVLITANLFADTITLKSGKQVEGKILERTDKLVKIEAFGVELTYFIDEIDQINQEKITLPSQETTLAIPQETNSGSTIKPIPSGEGKSANIADEVNTPAVASKEVAGGALLATMILLFLFYMYLAICLQFIAKKTGKQPVWLAWIPIGNLFLMCKIASISYLWLLGLLLAFIPFVGLVFNLLLLGYIWYRIAIARNKPGWLGPLACLPIINLVITGYLAFSE